MIRWLLALIAIALPLTLAAAPVVVKSGEHDGFTRLVLEYGSPVDWQVGRTSDGYELRLGGDAPAYDLSVVFDIIGKSRLAAIWVDPASKNLRIGIACKCHAIPFEFRPGIVVIDLRDGSPPKGSSFELALDGSDVETLAVRPPPRPKARPRVTNTKGYDWTELALPEAMVRPQVKEPQPVRADPAPAALDVLDPDLQPLRESLLRQLSRGAAQGVVDMEMPKPQEKRPPSAPFPSVRIGVGELPGVSSGPGLPRHDDIGSEGRDCVPAEALDIASWGDGRPVFEQMAEAMGGLSGEFDRPDPAALTRAVHFNLHLGFGAEARQLMLAFPVDAPDGPVWKSLAHLLDGDPDPDPFFTGLAACDGPSALWAFLSDPAPGKGSAVNTRAVVLAFSALPIHLRRHLGAEVGDRFLAMEEVNAARAIQDAVLRAPGGDGQEADLLQARMDMATGDHGAAAQKAEEALKESGPRSGEALIAFTEAQVAQTLPIEADVAMALAAMLPEHAGSPDEPAYRRATVLAAAASGDFDGALAEDGAESATVIDVWRLLARLGTDDAILAHAILPPEQPVPQVEGETMALLAERLIGLGFAEAALRWLTPAENFDPMLRAKAHLAVPDARSAIDALDGSADPAALMLLASAYQMLGEEEQAAQVFAAAGDEAAGWRAKGRAQDWEALASDGPEPWKDAAASIIAAEEAQPGAADGAGAASTEGGDAPAGSLARSHQLVENSAATRAALAALLTTLPAPLQNAAVPAN